MQINVLLFEIIPYVGYFIFLALLGLFAMSGNIVALILSNIIIFTAGIVYFMCHLLYAIYEEKENYE